MRESSLRWLASRPRWLLAGAFVLLLVGVVLGQVLSIWVLGGTAVVLVFLFFFATLMAFVASRETPRPPGPS
jgi:hypothetical protein